MPSGRTHDEITLWSLPLVAGGTYAQTRSSSLTLIVAGGFLFSGLMFGPDLDIYSQQFQRWGWLRWIWLPYQQSLHHRSFLSHGPVVGTALRILYLGIWIGAIAFGVVLVGDFLGLFTWNPSMASAAIARTLKQYPLEGIALFLGLELGAMSHSLSDWIGSAYKRFKKYGWSAIFNPGKKPRTPTKKRIKRHTSSTTRRPQKASTKRKS